MRYSIQELIDIVRVETENEDVSSSIGIQDKEIIRFINIAQRQIQSKIVSKSEKEYTSIVTLLPDLNTNGRVYSIPQDSFMRARVTSLWVDERLSKQVYINDLKITKLNVATAGCCNTPSCYYGCYVHKSQGYAIVANKIYITGSCDVNSQITIAYVKTVPELELPILQVTALTAVDMQGGTLAVDLNASSFNVNLLNTSRVYTLVDEQGVQIVQNIRLGAYNSALGTIPLSANNLPQLITTTENTYLVRGSNSSTHCDVEALAQDFITRYAIAKVLQRDGSSEYNVHSADLVALLNEIVDAYVEAASQIMDIQQFPEDY